MTFIRPCTGQPWLLLCILLHICTLYMYIVCVYCTAFASEDIELCPFEWGSGVSKKQSFRFPLKMFLFSLNIDRKDSTLASLKNINLLKCHTLIEVVLHWGLRQTSGKYVDKFTVWTRSAAPVVMTCMHCYALLWHMHCYALLWHLHCYDICTDMTYALLCTVMTYMQLQIHYLDIVVHFCNGWQELHCNGLYLHSLAPSCITPSNADCCRLLHTK